VFERKMQERQQFLDRFFVFTSDWEPPRDYSRTSGVVEEVRKAFFEIEERQRLEEEGAPKEEKFHEASEPLELSADVGRGGNKAKKPATRKKAPAKRAPRKKRSDAGEPLRIQPFARALNTDESQPSRLIPGPPSQADAQPAAND
jgi:general secretion pathway protein D